MPHSPMTKLTSLNRSKSILFILAFAIIGSAIIFTTRAASLFASLEPEQGTKTAGATTDSDSQASSGQYVQFGGTTPQPSLPTPQTTGWQHTGVTLSACTQTTISGTPAGTVVDGCDFPAGSSVTINGGGPVILKRSRIRAMGTDSTAVYIAPGAGPVTIEDVEITSLDRESINRIDRTIHLFPAVSAARVPRAEGSMRGTVGSPHMQLY